MRVRAVQRDLLSVTYLLTFGCYGHWLHGDSRGSVDRRRNRFGCRIDEENLGLLRGQLRLMRQHEPYVMGDVQRDAVMAAVREVCEFRGWDLLAVHVRQTHVHIVVSGESAPDRMITTFKAYSTRRLEQAEREERVGPRWAEHGSTRYLWTEEAVAAAREYVVERQGEPMAVYRGEERHR